MKTLILMRHAKSSWKDSNLPDRERPLNKRGKKDAPLMGKVLIEKELIPQKILCSSAVRTHQTLDELVEAIGYTGEVELLDNLYLAEQTVYLEELTKQPDTLERILVIGHNPGLESLVQIFSHRVESLPTAAVAHIVLPIQHWSELSIDIQGDLVELFLPEEVREELEVEPPKEKKDHKDHKDKKEKDKKEHKDKKGKK
jgi:phosphohistidine phosphatase